MIEEWKQISYAPNYEISNLSNIKNTTTNKLLTINYERLRKTKSRARPILSSVKQRDFIYIVLKPSILQIIQINYPVNHKTVIYIIIMLLI